MIFGQVLERQGNLVRLEGIAGWFVAAHLARPCPCGNATFRVLYVPGTLRHRVICPKCVKVKPEEVTAGTLEMGVIR